MIDGQPSCTIWCDMHMAMQAAAAAGVPVVDHYAGAIANTEVVTALACGRADWERLTTVIDGLALVRCRAEWIRHASDQRIRPRTDCFVIITQTGWTRRKRHPVVSIVKG